MRVAEMAFTVEQEGHENNLPEMIDIARQVFRIESLTEFANRKNPAVSESKQYI